MRDRRALGRLNDSKQMTDEEREELYPVRAARGDAGRGRRPAACAGSTPAACT